VKFLVFQHSELDHPGTFQGPLNAAGVSCRAVDLHLDPTVPPLDEFNGLIVMGGPQQVDEEALYPWLIAEKAVIREAVARDMPMLGVCLGSQLLADALGGSVGELARAEIGISDISLTVQGQSDPLFDGFDRTTRTLQWHLNAVTSLPVGAHHLMRSAQCDVQAFRVGRACYGVQFHMEITAELVRGVRAFPDYVAALEAQHGEGALERLAAETDRHAIELENNARRMIENFVELARP